MTARDALAYLTLAIVAWFVAVFAEGFAEGFAKGYKREIDRQDRHKKGEEPNTPHQPPTQGGEP